MPVDESPAERFSNSEAGGLLLSIALFEDDAELIEGAADRQMAHVRTFQSGPHSADSQKLLKELAAARVCLLDPAKKARYDAEFRRRAAACRPSAIGAGRPTWNDGYNSRHRLRALALIIPMKP